MKKHKILSIIKYCPYVLSVVLISAGLFIYGVLLHTGAVPSILQAEAAEGTGSFGVATAVRELKERTSGLLNGEEAYDYSTAGGPSEYVPGASVAERIGGSGGTAALGQTENAGAAGEAESVQDSEDNTAGAEEAAEETGTALNTRKLTEYVEGEIVVTPEEEKAEPETPGVQKTVTDENDRSATGFYDGFYAVDQGYLTAGDTLIIGDSRMQGFGMFSGLPNITNYAMKSYAVHQVFTKRIFDTPAGKLTLEECMALQPDRFRKIYIKFGLNEISWGRNGEFEAAYYRLIDMLKYYQPNAAIYVQSILHVTKSKAASSPVFGNENIDSRNEVIRTVADREHVSYLDLCSAFMDGEGYLPSEYTSDGVHLKAQYMQLWVNFLCNHAVIASPTDWNFVIGAGAAPAAAEETAPVQEETAQNETPAQTEAGTEGAGAADQAAAQAPVPAPAVPAPEQGTVTPAAPADPGVTSPDTTGQGGTEFTGQGGSISGEEDGWTTYETDWETGGGLF